MAQGAPPWQPNLGGDIPGRISTKKSHPMASGGPTEHPPSGTGTPQRPLPSRSEEHDSWMGTSHALCTHPPTQFSEVSSKASSRLQTPQLSSCTGKRRLAPFPGERDSRLSCRRRTRSSEGVLRLQTSQAQHHSCSSVGGMRPSYSGRPAPALQWAATLAWLLFTGRQRGNHQSPSPILLLLLSLITHIATAYTPDIAHPAELPSALVRFLEGPKGPSASSPITKNLLSPKSSLLSTSELSADSSAPENVSQHVLPYHKACSAVNPSLYGRFPSPKPSPKFTSLLPSSPREPSAGSRPGLHVLHLTHKLKKASRVPGTPLHVALLEMDRMRHGGLLSWSPGEDGRDEEDGGRRGLQEGNGRMSHNALSGATFPNGLYFTTLGLGTPPQYLNLNVDTGSNLLWVNCEPCQPCTTSQNQVQNSPFDTASSSTARPIACSSPYCGNIDRTVRTINCSSAAAAGTAPCAYSVSYADLSSTTGTLVADVIRLPTASGDVKVQTTLGCGNTQTGNFLSSPSWTYYESVDGLLGLGRGGFSIMAAIAAQQSQLGISPKLTHCLGGVEGGGWIVFGDMHVDEDEMPFTPLFPHPTWYKVGMVRVTVGGRQLSVNPGDYGNATEGNGIIDSGTTFTILPDTFVPAILNLIQHDVGLPRYTFAQTDSGSLCFATTTELNQDAIRELMPSINVQFVGSNVFLNVPPSAYSFETKDGDTQLVCTQLLASSGFKAAKTGIHFIVGDIWLRDLLVIHDIPKSRIGWQRTKCS